MKDIDVVYLYEHAARELDVACAVKYIAQKYYGIRIEIAQWPHGFHRISGKFHPRLIVLPFCYSEESFVLCLVDYLKVVYFNLSWEQLFYKGNQTAKTPRRDFACNHVIHHAWNQVYAEFLKQNGIPEKHIFVNGNPAYTLYEEPYRRYFKNRRDLATKHRLDPARKWIFFPENYNWAFYSDATLKRFIRDGQSQDEVYGMRDFCRRSLEEVIKWCNDVAEHDTVEVIIRPRPSTPLNDFKNALARIIPATLDRLRVIQDDSVRDWILSSDIVISSHSTSLIEASVSGKVVYMLEPYPIPPALHNEWHSLVPRIKSHSELLEVCLYNPKTTRDQRLEAWARTTMMANGDAIFNLTDYIGGICQGKIEPPPFPSIKSATPPSGLPIPSWLLFGYRKLRWLKKRRNPPAEIEPELVKDIVSQEEIEQRVARWEQILKDYLRGV